jgi:hypothetical protein
MPERAAMTLNELMNGAAWECIDEREAHVIIFTQGAIGYVCLNTMDTTESKALFRGEYRSCQVWIERRGVSAALNYIRDHLNEVPDFIASQSNLQAFLAMLTEQSK